MAGLTKEGFERKSFAEIKTEIEEALKSVFGDDIDLRSESVFGQLVGVLSLPISDLWSELENTYLAFDPDYAEGTSLDSLAALTGVTRIDATHTVVGAVLYGNAGTTVAANSEARSSTTEDVFLLQEAVTIEASNLVRAKITVNTVSNSTDYTITINGTDYTITSGSEATQDDILLAINDELDGVSQYEEVNVLQEIVLSENDLEAPFTLSVSANLTISELGSPGTFVAEEAGAIIVPSGALDEVQTSVAGWEAVQNPFDGIIGKDRENDSNLRLRRRQSVSYPATSTVDALRSKILQVEDVSAVVVFENYGASTDSNGVPPQHIWAIVQGGEDKDIAGVIYQSKPGGIGMHGDTSVSYESDSGQVYNILFERPEEVDLHVSMTIVPTDGYAAEAPEQIKKSVAQWVADNLSIGDGLKYSRLFTPINSIKGFEVTELLIGTSSPPSGETSITIDVDQVITCDTANISITVDE